MPTNVAIHRSPATAPRIDRPVPSRRSRGPLKIETPNATRPVTANPANAENQTVLGHGSNPALAGPPSM